MLKNIEHVCKTLCKLLEDIHVPKVEHISLLVYFYAVKEHKSYVLWFIILFLANIVGIAVNYFKGFKGLQWLMINF